MGELNKRRRGTKWEEQVIQYLTDHEVRIIEHSYRCRSGEIDLIGYDGECLVFFEVKYRSNTENGFAEEAVDYRKQCKICRVSDYYRYAHQISETCDMRYDVIAINGITLHWYKNAFPYIGGF